MGDQNYSEALEKIGFSLDKELKDQGISFIIYQTNLKQWRIDSKKDFLKLSESEAITAYQVLQIVYERASVFKRDKTYLFPFCYRGGSNNKKIYYILYAPKQKTLTVFSKEELDNISLPCILLGA